MRKNTIPGLIGFAPALLLPLVQDVARPRVPHTSLLGFVLSSAPDLVIAFCFPFSILIRPRAWTERIAVTLFGVWAIFTLVVLVVFEFHDPFGQNTFDPADIAASFVGVALAGIVFQIILRPRLTFGEDQPALTTEQLAGE
jgi:hypothetical protein